MKISDKAYNILKWICITALPALITLYGVIGATLHLPYVQETLTIATAVDTCLGTLLGISSIKYYQTQAQSNHSVNDVMVAVEKWMTDHEIEASKANIDVPEE